jgi:uncharacterized membrane protein
VQAWNDQRIEQFLGNLLRAGVVASALVVLLGAGLYLAREGRTQHDYATFHGEPSKFTSAPDIARAASRLEGRAVIQLGILLLLATPVARVALSAVAFALERDRMYVIFTLVVLTLLLLSLTGVAA